jgi:hypothetical protein
VRYPLALAAVLDYEDEEDSKTNIEAISRFDLAKAHDFG